MFGNIGWAEGLILILFWAAVLGIGLLVVLLLVRALSAGGTRPGEQAPRESALDILQKRYARGELSREQYQQMRQDLEGPQSTADTSRSPG